MQKKLLLIVGVVVVLIAALWVLKEKYVGAVAVPWMDSGVESAPQDAITSRLTVPEGFKISVYASGVPSARVLALDPKGRMLVSQIKEGQITTLRDADGDGAAEERSTLAEGLDSPHGLAFDCPQDDRGLPCYLYLAEHSRLGRYSYNAEAGTVSGYTKLADLEASRTDRHTSRTLLFLPSPKENILLVSIGSSCNVCNESDDQRGRIMAYDTKTGTLTEYAKGLRNAVFMELNPVDGRVFATEMGRDGLGDDTPPDELNLIEKGKNYGWPVCYGKNIHDTAFDKNTYIRNPCMEPFEMPSFVDLQAHSAPLGLAFVPEEGWPEEYWYDALVALHGSWNRAEPVGYRIVRVALDTQGRYQGTHDFITGWLTKEGTKLGRPVDIKTFPGGVAYISDDASGVIYKLSRE
jgi:glucose/arabinose dehydrogenase